MSQAKVDYTNTVLVVNKAKTDIKIDRDPNFDDMTLSFGGQAATGPFVLATGKEIHVGSSYGADMGLCLTYGSDERYMELGMNDSGIFDVLSDSEDDGSGPLKYTIADKKATGMAVTFLDR